METGRAFALAAVLLALVGGGSLAVALASVVQQRSRQHAADPGRLWRRGVRPLLPFARILLRFGHVGALAEAAAESLRDKGRAARADAVLSVFLAALAAVAAAAFAFSGSALAGLAVAVCVCAAAGIRVKAIEDRRRDELREAVPDALRSMGACFQSGLSLSQTFAQIAKESHGPLQALFQRASGRLETGGSTQEALAELRMGSHAADLAFIAAALDVQHQTGGSMRQVLDAARETAQGELDLRRALRVQTAQARLSARVVSVLPFVLIALFSLVSEGFLMPFFSSAAGAALLVLALGMQAAGIVIVRRMLAVEVG